jgi:ABC-type Fe3+-siderophore transport system permease subunit
MQSRTRNPLPADALLFVVVGSLLATVAAVWLMVTISEGWAVVLAIAIAITGVVSLMAVMNRELDEDDDDSPSD